MRTVIRMLHEAADKYGGRAFVSSKTSEGWKPFSYREVDSSRIFLSRHFLTKNLRPARQSEYLRKAGPNG